MATLPQRPLFCWNEIDELGDLHRLRLVLEALGARILCQYGWPE